jgi:hypothetical protein
VKSLRLTEQQLAAIRKRGKPEKIAFGMAPQARNKFNAKKKEVDGILFDSTKEAKVYEDLKLRQHAGEISALECQVSFDLIVNENLIARYIADFVFNERDLHVVADAKGHKTPVYQLKKKLMRAIYGIDILEL